MLTVKRLGQDTGRTGLTHPARAGKQEGMSHPAGINGILKRTADMFLTGQSGKGLGAIFTGENFVGHG
jgi:hypothetical protein